MKWMIGLDLRREGRGALGFARWVRTNALRPQAHTFVGVHVIEEMALLSALERQQLGEVETAVRHAAKAELERAGLADVVETPALLEGVDADVALADRAEGHQVDALVIGRRADARDERWTRLGRVARRLLRSLPVPVVVVPPDLAAANVGDGPVLLATDLSPDSAGAARFATTFGRAVGRPVVLVHILPTFDAGTSFVPAATIEQLYHQLGMEREKSLETWKRDQGLADAPAIVAAGDVVGRVVAIAKEERASMVVCGSRRLGAAERLFRASVGTALAGYSGCAVAVVPPLGA